MNLFCTCFLIILNIFMPVICWGPLGKTAQDPTTIADYIASKILDHNVNPSAHGLDGYSVYNHRAGVLLDHPDDSVTLQKLLYNRFLIQTQFDTIDAWDTSGNVFLQAISQAELVATGHPYVKSRMAIIASDANEEGANISNDPEFQTTIKTTSKLSQLAYAVQGDVDGAKFFGFMIADGQLNAVHTDDNENMYIQAINTINLTRWSVLRAIVKSGESIEFFVNHHSYFKAENNLPSGLMGAFIMYYIINSVPAGKTLYIQDLLYQEDNFI